MATAQHSAGMTIRIKHRETGDIRQYDNVVRFNAAADRQGCKHVEWLELELADGSVVKERGPWDVGHGRVE